MKFIVFAVALFGICTYATAGDTHVRGYTRKDRTYVQPHDRSAPDGNRSNNYGRPSYQQQQMYNTGYGNSQVPRQERDADGDGISNRHDDDDDNDGISDQYDR